MFCKGNFFLYKNHSVYIKIVFQIVASRHCEEERRSKTEIFVQWIASLAMTVHYKNDNLKCTPFCLDIFINQKINIIFAGNYPMYAISNLFQLSI